MKKSVVATVIIVAIATTVASAVIRQVKPTPDPTVDIWGLEEPEPSK